MKVIKELKGIAKRADYYFIHVDGHKATLEFMQSKDARGEFNPNHLASYNDIDCDFNDYTKQYSRYTGKARVFVSDYDAKTLLSLLQILHNDTELYLLIHTSANSELLTNANMVRDAITLLVSKNGKRVGEFRIFEHVGYDNTARPVHFS